MKVPITIRRAHFGTIRRCIISQSFISNGHWAIRKSHVANAALFADQSTVGSAFSIVDIKTCEDALIQEMFDRVEKRSTYPMADTGVLIDVVDQYQAAKIGRIYTRNGGTLSVFENKYLELFGITDNDAKIATDTDGAAALFADCLLFMPIRSDTILETIDPIMPALEMLCVEGGRFATNMERKQRLQVVLNRATNTVQACHQQLEALATKQAA